MRILIIEDQLKVAQSLQHGLESERFDVTVASTGEDGFFLVSSQVFDLLILDLMLPGRDGLEILRTVRQRGLATPVIILSARDTVEDRIRGLDQGADDYLVKPFDLDELSARIRALMRRHGGRASPVIEHGPLRLDPATHEFFLDGTPVNLSGREFSLLHALLEQPGVPLSRAQLEERIYGWNEEIESNAIEVYIHRLRKKIEKGPIRIATVRGLGYCLEKIPG